MVFFVFCHVFFIVCCCFLFCFDNFVCFVMFFYYVVFLFCHVFVGVFVLSCFLLLFFCLLLFFILFCHFCLSCFVGFFCLVLFSLKDCEEETMFWEKCWFSASNENLITQYYNVCKVCKQFCCFMLSIIWGMLCISSAAMVQNKLSSSFWAVGVFRKHVGKRSLFFPVVWCR